MSSRRPPSRSTTAHDPNTPTPSSSSLGQHVISDISDQLTPRLLSTRSTGARGGGTTTSRLAGQTPSTSRRLPARTPAAAASTSRVSTGKGKGRAAELRETGGGRGRGEEGGRRSTPRRRAQPSSSSSSIPIPPPPPPASIHRTRQNTIFQSAQSDSSDADDTEEVVSQSEEEDEEDELEEEEEAPNERESAFHAAASSLHDFYLSSPAGKAVDRATEELLFNVLRCECLPEPNFPSFSPSSSRLSSSVLS